MKQSIDNLKSEIQFREKLARQHVEGDQLIKEYIQKKDHDQLMHERVNTTYQTMQNLKNDGVQLSPFIELGAERGHRSLVLTNDFQAHGFALDISYHQLKTLDYWKDFFSKPKLPLRICCNTYSLPFKSQSLRFAFCYQFLHHFPSLEPVLKEIHRVLSLGYFYFAEEPYKRFSLKLYRRKINNKPGRIKKIFTYIESFFAQQYEVEESYGIIENDEITLNQWLSALSIFNNRRVFLQSAASLFRSEMGNASALKMRIHRLMGGGISALVKKEPPSLNKEQIENSNLYDLLGCPECVISGSNGSKAKAPLKKRSDHLKCTFCNRNFPIIDDIIFLLPYREMKELYPQFLK